MRAGGGVSSVKPRVNGFVHSNSLVKWQPIRNTICSSDTHTEHGTKQHPLSTHMNTHTHAPADPRHCCVTITRTWIHFHPEQAMFTHAYETRKQCVGYTTTFTQAFRKTQPEIHTVYIYACSSLLYETIIKHICMVQTWCRWFLPAEEAVHACSQSNRTENKTSETFFSAKGTAAHLKQTSTCGRKWKTNEKGAERGTTYGKRKRSATQQERGEGNRKIESERERERERHLSVSSCCCREGWSEL